MKIRLSAAARADLDEIWLYVAERDSIEAADRLVDRITATFSLLSAHPRIGKLREDICANTRVFAVLPYLIFYRERSRRIEVSRILHGARDVRSLEL